MMRLKDPSFSYENSLDQCIAGITGNSELSNKLTTSKLSLLAGEASYVAAAQLGELYKFAPVSTIQTRDPIVINDLHKSELIKFYDQYFVPDEKPARKIYDALMNAANERCPFCGGIGTPRNLDHFMPKAHFPQFSILPRNLVPSCRDCNMDGKGHTYALSEADQIIQPYVDNDKFFRDQWIFAEYNVLTPNDPGEFEYCVIAPQGWSEIEKKRVKKHFDDFGLAKRYATKAAEALGTVMQQVASMRKVGLDSQLIHETLLQPGIDAAPFINHWQTGMYQALQKKI